MRLIFQQIIEDIPNRIQREEKRKYMAVLVKNQICQLENDELEYNLRLQEKFNVILVEEIKKLWEATEKWETVKPPSLENLEVPHWNLESLSSYYNGIFKNNHSIFFKKHLNSAEEFQSESKNQRWLLEALPPINDEAKFKKHKFSFKSRKANKEPYRKAPLRSL